VKEWKPENSGDNMDNVDSEGKKSRTERLAPGEKKAAAKAMNLLLYKDRTEYELRQRLLDAEFEPEDAEAAIEYVKSFGYLNDYRYAENYVVSMKSRKSVAVIRADLAAKHVAEEYVLEALEKFPIDESEMIYALLCKKAGEPHKMDEKELRRTFGFLARKGFGSGAIWKEIRRFQNPDYNN